MCISDCSVRRARRDGSGCCDDRDMQNTAMVETVNAELRAAWQLEKRLPGGLNTGAYLVPQHNLAARRPGPLRGNGPGAASPPPANETRPASPPGHALSSHSLRPPDPC